MKATPCTGPKILTPTGVGSAAWYLKYMPINRPAHVRASTKATVANTRPMGLIGKARFKMGSGS
ncbi:hypothetical protein D3C86_2119770 [compost metagenome]